MEISLEPRLAKKYVVLVVKFKSLVIGALSIVNIAGVVISCSIAGAYPGWCHQWWSRYLVLVLVVLLPEPTSRLM